VPDIPSAVIAYISVLAQSRDATTLAGDRQAYDRHLAAAARLVALLARDDHAAVAEWLRVEERDFGWGYLSGEPGEKAEQALTALRDALGVG
jgi:hypothetical protein